MRAGRPPQSATSRHYAEPIQANDAYDELDGDYDLAGRDSNDVDEGYVHRVRPRPASLGSRRTSDMSISVQGPAAPRQAPAPPYVVSRDKPRRAASPLAEFAADPLAAMRYDEDVDLDAEYDAVDDFHDDDGYVGDGEWTGHNQVEGPPTLSGPVESYASPEHRRQQAQARRAAAARVAAQREDSSDLAPEHPGRVSTTPRNRSSAGSSRSGDHLARFETGDY